MSTGTKVFLACFALLVAALVVYYGVLVPSKPGEQPIDTVRPDTTLASNAEAPQSRFAEQLDTIDQETTPPATPPASDHSATILEDSSPDVAASQEPTRTFEAAPQSATPAEQTPRTIDYTIIEGDTLSSIALDRLGDANVWHRIRELNPSIDPDRLRVGSTIRIPVADTLTGVEGTMGSDAYVVKEGETLISISRRIYGNDRMWRQIYAANRAVIGGSPDMLEPGMHLRLPQ